MDETIFKVNLSKGIIALYSFITVAMIILFSSVLLFSSEEMVGWERTVFIITFAFIVFLFSFMLLKASKMNFKISQGKVIIFGIFKTNEIQINDITAIKKSPIPFGFRLFGASLLGGYYYLPNIGFTWVSMGNFKDGVLIQAKNKKNFVITPENPMDFINEVERRMH